MNGLLPAYSHPLVADYCRKRGISEALALWSNLRACSEPEDGLIIPNKFYDGTTDYFQIRRLGDKNPKYIGLPEVDKPLYGVERIGVDQIDVVVCEGPLSALAMEEAERYCDCHLW